LSWFLSSLTSPNISWSWSFSSVSAVTVESTNSSAWFWGLSVFSDRRRSHSAHTDSSSWVRLLLLWGEKIYDLIVLLLNNWRKIKTVKEMNLLF
jgi:hypothetical protein